MQDLHIIFVCGPCGVGKTTYGEFLEQTQQFVLFETDRKFMDVSGTYKFDSSKLSQFHQETQYMFLEEVKKGKRNIVVTNTMLTAYEFVPYIMAWYQYGIHRYRLKFVYPEDLHSDHNPIFINDVLQSDVLISRRQGKHGKRIDSKIIENMVKVYTQITIEDILACGKTFPKKFMNKFIDDLLPTSVCLDAYLSSIVI